MMDIYDELALIADTKETLRLSLGLRKDVPFSQYASHIPYYLKAGTVFDFVNNQYSKDQLPANLNDISEFIRLSSATMWQNGKLVEVADNTPRIGGEGLLIESQATNVIRDNTFTSAIVNTSGRVSLYDVKDSSIPDAKLLRAKVEWSTRSGGLTSLQNNGEYPISNTVTLQEGYHRSYIVKNSGGARYASLINSDSTGGGAVIDFAEEAYVGNAAGSIRNLGGGWWELRLWHDFNTSISNKRFRVAFGNTLNGTDLVTEIGDNVFVAYPSVYDAKDIDLSVIPTYGTAVTRAPDTLNISLLPTQAITGDWDEGVSYAVSGSIATFAGHGYIRNIVVVGDPISPFKDGEKGFWIDPSDTSTLFQDSDGTIPVVDGDPIGLVLDRSGNNYHLTQTVSASRPKLLNGGIVFDRVDDALTLTVPAGGITGTLFLATTRGTASYGVSIPAGVWSLGNNHGPLGDVVSAVLVDRVLTMDEKARLHVFGIGKGGTEFGVETTFWTAFRWFGHILVDLPMIDTSSVSTFGFAWFGCSGLVSFPLLDISSATSFQSTWANCSSLTSFPVNFFDNCLATNFSSAFRTTNLSQASIDGILVSINSNATSNGTFDQSGGIGPSAVGQAAIDAMRARGWTVSTKGGY